MIERSHNPSHQQRVDSAVALADQRVGIGTTVLPSGFDAPHFNPVSPGQPPTGERPDWARGSAASAQFGVGGTPIVSGFLTELAEYNPELQGRNAMPVYEQMRRGDAQVQATVGACELPVMSAKWEVNPPKQLPAHAPRSASTGAGKSTAAKAKQVADFIRENLLGGLEFKTASGAWVNQDWSSVVQNALLMLTFGCAAHEDVYAVDGDVIRLRMLADLPARTFYRFVVEDDGRTLKWLGQYGYRGAQFLEVSVPASKVCLFTYRREGANYYGRALLRAAYPHWYAKSKLYRIDAIGCERNSMGVPVITLPPGASAEDRQSAVDYVTQLAAHERTGLVLPNGATFELVGVKGTLRSVAPSIAHHNEEISMAALAMFLNLGRTASGSRALGGTQSKFFMLALQNTADQIAFDITRTTIRRLVALNFGDDAPVPELHAANVQARDIGETIVALKDLAISGAFVSDRPARDLLRGELGFAEETDEGIVSIKGETVTEGADQDVAIDKSGAEALPAKGAKPAPQPKAQFSERRMRRGDRTQVSPFWRDGHDPKLKMVSPREAHIDFPAIQAEHGRAERQITKVLADAKPGLMRSYAKQMGKALDHGQDPASVSFAPNAELRDKLRSEVSRAMNFGADQVRQERKRLQARPRQIKLADASPAVASKRYQLIAEIAASDVETDIGNATRKSANDLRRAPDFEEMSPAEIADRLFGATNDTAYVDDGIAKAGREAARSAMAAGRNDALVAGRAELEREGGFYERTGMLDDNECDNCGDHDGDTRPASAGAPAPTTSDGICEAGPLCRCEWFEVIE